jgi:hypothetical protein
VAGQPGCCLCSRIYKILIDLSGFGYDAWVACHVVLGLWIRVWGQGVGFRVQGCGGTAGTSSANTPRRAWPHRNQYHKFFLSTSNTGQDIQILFCQTKTPHSSNAALGLLDGGASAPMHGKVRCSSSQTRLRSALWCVAVTTRFHLTHNVVRACSTRRRASAGGCSRSTSRRAAPIRETGGAAASKPPSSTPGRAAGTSRWGGGRSG